MAGPLNVTNIKKLTEIYLFTGISARVTVMTMMTVVVTTKRSSKHAYKGTLNVPCSRVYTAIDPRVS